MTATYPLARPSAFAANATNPLATLDSDLVNLTDTLNGLGNGVSVIATATITTASITNANITNGFIANASIASMSANTAVFVSPLGISSGGTNATTFGNNAVVVITAGSMAGVLPAANGTVLTSNGTAWGPALVSSGFPAAAPITNSLAADVLLNNTANYFDGPSVAQGSSGTWFVSGTVTVEDTAGIADFNAKLWDGTTVIASGRAFQTGGQQITITLSGVITSPAGNLRISVNDPSSTSGKIQFNASGNSKDSTISAYRIL